MSSRKTRVSLTLALAGALVARNTAQCSTQWLPRHPGTDGNVWATTMWDRDGAGPMPPVLVLGGEFQVAGSAPVASNIATYDPVSGVWSALGTGIHASLYPRVEALTALPNGDLVAGGQFSSAGGVSASMIARWNGTSWSALGSGMNGWVRALTSLPNGDLVAGGGFASGIARWDGTNWSGLGSGMNAEVLALTTLPNGDLVAGGRFSSAGGVSASYIARWDGTSWSALSTGLNGYVNALRTLPNGDLVAGGQFTSAGGVSASCIARWDGTSWSALGTGTNAEVYSLASLPNGDLAVGGSFSSAGSVSAANIARWNGTSWSALGSGTNGHVWALTALPNGDLAAGGGFTSAGGVGAANIARWNGTGWWSLGPGMNNPVRALTMLPNGDLVMGGYFTSAGGVSANGVALWNGTGWSALGSGISGWFLDLVVNAVTSLPNGDLVAGGRFTSMGGVSCNSIARWNGSSWSALGSGMLLPTVPAIVRALATLPNGDLVAGGYFTSAGGVGAANIARWNGTSWSALGSGMSSSFSPGVHALTTLPNGDLVAGGRFGSAGGVSASSIARWNGTNWSALGSGVTGSFAIVEALTPLPNGDLVAGGSFTMAGGVGANYIARWDGTSWSALGSGTNGVVTALTTLPNGDLLVGGGFTMAGGVSASGIARWDGTGWSALGTGMSLLVGAQVYSGGVYALTTLPNGDIMAGGVFTSAGGVPSAYVAQLTTTCPATAASFGAGCAGSAGPNVLTATSLPWTGSTFTSRATGMPAISLALSVLGFNTVSVPLSSILPQGVAGCTLFVSPDLLALYVPSAGSVTTQFAIPNSVALAGQLLHQQVVPIELDAAGNVVALTSTNALTLTIGAF